MQKQTTYPDQYILPKSMKSTVLKRLDTLIHTMEKRQRYWIEHYRVHWTTHDILAIISFINEDTPCNWKGYLISCNQIWQQVHKKQVKHDAI